MKNRYLFPGMIGIMAICCCSCASTNLMSLSVTEPAPVSLPPASKTAVIVNRSRAADENKTVDAIHKALSLETRQLQVDGARASAVGLKDELIKVGRFTTVKNLDYLDLRSYGAGVFPSYMSWDTVEKICRENNADILFSLELFDAESKVGVNPVGITSPLAAIATVNQEVSVNTRIKTGWRIYDPVSHSVLDQFIIYRDLNFQNRGLTSTLIGRKEAVNKAGIYAAQDYGQRIVPYSIRVSRFYFVRGDGNFIVARRMAQSGDWDEAGKLWQQETQSRSRKAAGRACYNMAIISEINGDLNAALNWAQKSYEVYNVRLALSYVNLLQQRLANNALLKSQTELSSAP
jgi:uncharacterized protein DUF6340